MPNIRPDVCASWDFLINLAEKVSELHAKHSARFDAQLSKALQEETKRVRRMLRAAWALRKEAEVGQEWVCPIFRDGRENPRTVALRYVRRAGLAPWPRLFQNLRASLESELVADFPIHTVARWLGNTPAVAMKHYLTDRPEDFRRAAEWRPGGAGSVKGCGDSRL